VLFNHLLHFDDHQSTPKIQETYPDEFFWRPLRKGRRGRKPALFEIQMASSLVEQLLAEPQETLPTVEALVG
jgi:hypothetical protein